MKKKFFEIEHYSIGSPTTECANVEANNIVEAIRKFTRMQFRFGDLVIKYEVESIKSIRSYYSDDSEVE